MNRLKLSTLIPEDKIYKRVAEIGKHLSDRFRGQDLTVICILKGSFVFYADLIRSIETDLQCEFFGVASYHDAMKSSGEVKLTLDLAHPVEGKNVVLVEDIVDTGLTMNYLLRTLEARRPKSLTTVSLLLKPDALKVQARVDFVGFEIPNEFVVGYGLDYQGYYRNLPYVARVENLN